MMAGASSSGSKARWNCYSMPSGTSLPAVSGYDPARKDFWKGHNRPWDYDHILAKTYVHSKQEDHKRACGEWLNTIATSGLGRWRIIVRNRQNLRLKNYLEIAAR